MENRKLACKTIMEKYPGHYPVFIEKYSKCSLPALTKNKFLIPGDFTIGQVIFLIRKRISLKPSEAIFVYVCKGNETLLVACGDVMHDVYERYKKEDDMLYLKYSTENTFGAGDIGE
jgi:GABA(A) receptor-associated protein